MDNLTEVAKKVMGSFNPETDAVDNYENLPDGEYKCLLEDVTAKSNEKGTNWITLRFSVIEGEYENRNLFVNYFFTEKTTERSIKSIMKLAYEFGYTIPVEAFTSLNELAESLNAMAGNTALVKQTTSKNDFTNYKVTVE